MSRGVEVYLSWLHRPTINGAFGIDVGLNTKAVEALSRELPKTGVTSFLPTVISWPAERYADYVGAMRPKRSHELAGRGATRRPPRGTAIVASTRGAHDPANLQPVNRETHGEALRLKHGSHDDPGARASHGEGGYSAPSRRRSSGE